MRLSASLQWCYFQRIPVDLRMQTVKLWKQSVLSQVSSHTTPLHAAFTLSHMQRLLQPEQDILKQPHACTLVILSAVVVQVPSKSMCLTLSQVKVQRTWHVFGRSR